MTARWLKIYWICDTSCDRLLHVRQNRLHFAIDVHCTLGWLKKTQFCGNQLLFHFLNFYVEKKTLTKAVACTMIFNTASYTKRNLGQLLHQEVTLLP